ncbi:hypothetical protein [Micromonospora sp. DT41]|uniref:hypothetical protein n=1 Tax=Micromonospora sp. DT41 TaxID=3393437 RepID=UPI003CE9078D
MEVLEAFSLQHGGIDKGAAAGVMEQVGQRAGDQNRQIGRLLTRADPYRADLHASKGGTNLGLRQGPGTARRRPGVSDSTSSRFRQQRRAEVGQLPVVPTVLAQQVLLGRVWQHHDLQIQRRFESVHTEPGSDPSDADSKAFLAVRASGQPTRQLTDTRRQPAVLTSRPRASIVCIMSCPCRHL